MRSDHGRNGDFRFPWLRNNILSLVAITLAVSGTTAVASQVVIDGAGKSAKKGKRGPRGPAGPPGQAGAPGAAGSAVAYAHVNANGTLDAANSKNIAATEGSAQPGYYCVGPSVPFKNFVVSADVSGGGAGFFATASFIDNLTDCADGEVVVSTWKSSNEALTATPFYIVFN